MRVGVVGAGVVGLAITCELLRLGTEVRCFEMDAAMSARSAGSSRIFRLAHGAPELVEHAQRARASWRRWEQAVGGNLIGAEGVVVTGQDAAVWAEAMRAAGVDYQLFETGDHHPELVPTAAVPAPVLFDPAGGVIDVSGTARLLCHAAAETITRGVVYDVTAGDTGVTVSSADGLWRCDVVVIAAGAALDQSVPPALAH